MKQIGGLSIFVPDESASTSFDNKKETKILPVETINTSIENKNQLIAEAISELPEQEELKLTRAELTMAGKSPLTSCLPIQSSVIFNQNQKEECNASNLKKEF